jgi:hypothetical protein
MGKTETIMLTLDAFALFAVALMLYLTEEAAMDTTPTETIETTEHRVFSMLDDAYQHNYHDLIDWSVDDIVADLLAFAELRDDEVEDTIRPHVITWKMKHRNFIA